MRPMESRTAASQFALSGKGPLVPTSWHPDSRPLRSRPKIAVIYQAMPMSSVLAAGGWISFEAAESEVVEWMGRSPSTMPSWGCKSGGGPAWEQTAPAGGSDRIVGREAGSRLY